MSQQSEEMEGPLEGHPAPVVQFLPSDPASCRTPAGGARFGFFEVLRLQSTKSMGPPVFWAPGLWPFRNVVCRHVITSMLPAHPVSQHPCPQDENVHATSIYRKALRTRGSQFGPRFNQNQDLENDCFLHFMNNETTVNNGVSLTGKS